MDNQLSNVIRFPKKHKQQIRERKNQDEWIEHVLANQAEYARRTNAKIQKILDEARVRKDA